MSRYSKDVLVAAKKVCDSYDCPPCGCYTCKPVTEPLPEGVSMSVCPLAKFQNSIATMEPVNENLTFEELAALCRACNHTGKYGKRTNQSFYTYCINCPVENIRDCMMECAAEAACS